MTDVERTWLRAGLDPEEPDQPVLVIVVDPNGEPGDRAVCRLADCGHESDGAFYLLQTDG